MQGAKQVQQNDLTVDLGKTVALLSIYRRRIGVPIRDTGCRVWRDDPASWAQMSIQAIQPDHLAAKNAQVSDRPCLRSVPDLSCLCSFAPRFTPCLRRNLNRDRSWTDATDNPFRNHGVPYDPAYRGTTGQRIYQAASNPTAIRPDNPPNQYVAHKPRADPIKTLGV